MHFQKKSKRKTVTKTLTYCALFSSAFSNLANSDEITNKTPDRVTSNIEEDKQNTTETDIARGLSLGIKGGYQLYQGKHSSVDSFAAGVFLNYPISNDFSIGGEILHLGNGKKDNGNHGHFTTSSIYAGYHIPLFDDHELVPKLGVTPWLGYVEYPDGSDSYETGITGTVGAAYILPINNKLDLSFEYQYTPNLGGELIGSTDSHLFSIGLAWKQPQKIQVVNIIKQEAPIQHIPVKDKPVEGVILSKENDLTNEYRVYGSWFFNSGSSKLIVPTPFKPLDHAREIMSQGCNLQSILVLGYADGTGDETYNYKLSEKRAHNVADYLKYATGNDVAVKTSWHGSERLPQGTSSLYERRVDFNLVYQCEKSNSHD